MFPPINSTNCFTIDSPSPVPPNLRVVESSACSKALKIPSILSSAIPIPVSVTRIWTVAGDVSCILNSSSTCPFSVNLTALPAKLNSICRVLAWSPTNWMFCGTLFLIMSLMPLSSAREVSVLSR